MAVSYRNNVKQCTGLNRLKPKTDRKVKKSEIYNPIIHERIVNDKYGGKRTLEKKKRIGHNFNVCLNTKAIRYDIEWKDFIECHSRLHILPVDTNPCFDIIQVDRIVSENDMKRKEQRENLQSNENRVSYDTQYLWMCISSIPTHYQYRTTCFQPLPAILDCDVRMKDCSDAGQELRNAIDAR